MLSRFDTDEDNDDCLSGDDKDAIRRFFDNGRRNSALFDGLFERSIEKANYEISSNVAKGSDVNTGGLTWFAAAFSALFIAHALPLSHHGKSQQTSSASIVDFDFGTIQCLCSALQSAAMAYLREDRRFDELKSDVEMSNDWVPVFVHALCVPLFCAALANLSRMILLRTGAQSPGWLDASNQSRNNSSRMMTARGRGCNSASRLSPTSAMQTTLVQCVGAVAGIIASIAAAIVFGTRDIDEDADLVEWQDRGEIKALWYVLATVTGFVAISAMFAAIQTRKISMIISGVLSIAVFGAVLAFAVTLERLLFIDIAMNTAALLLSMITMFLV